MITRKQILEDFLNDKVEAVKPFEKQLFFWRGMYYEVIPYKDILKDKTRKASHFIKRISGHTLYGLRELSGGTLTKHYRKNYLEMVRN